MRSIQKAAVTPHIVAQFNRLTFDQALQVYKLADDKERLQLRRELVKKWYSADPATRKQYGEQYKQLLSGGSFGL